MAAGHSIYNFICVQLNKKIIVNFKTIAEPMLDFVLYQSVLKT